MNTLYNKTDKQKKIYGQENIEVECVSHYIQNMKCTHPYVSIYQSPNVEKTKLLLINKYVH